MGDYNVNLLNLHRETTDFVDILHSNSFVYLINRPTRINGNSATLIETYLQIVTQIFMILFSVSYNLIQRIISLLFILLV